MQLLVTLFMAYIVVKYEYEIQHLLYDKEKI